MIRVFLVDDHTVLREGMKRLIDDEPGLSVVGEAGGGVEALAKLATAECDVVLLDLNLPGRTGFDVLETLRDKRPELKIIVLSMYPESQYAARLLRAGAKAFLSKGRGSDEVIAAIRAVAAGQRFGAAPPSAAQPKSGGEPLPHELLSDREAEVFRRLAEGTSPTDIALELGLSPSTISTYVARIKDKLGAASLGEIVQYAYRHRLVE